MIRHVVRAVPAALVLMLAACGSGGGGGAGGAGGAGGSLSTDPAFAGGLADVQRAINDAAPGATVQIGVGVFDGRLVVRKSIVLVGSGVDTVLRGVQGLDDAVIEVVDTADVVIADLTVSGPRHGVTVRGSTRVRLEDLVALGNGEEGIDVRDSRAVVVLRCDSGQNGSGGVRVRESSTDVLVDDCLVEANFDQGVEVRDATNVTVRACVVRGNVGDGVRLRDSGAVELQGNTIDGNSEYGVRAITTPVDPAQLRSQNQIGPNGQGDVRVEG